MLKLPALRRIGDVTVFADDQLWYKFYLIGKEPSIRLDERGRPVFLLTSFQIDTEARKANPSLPTGAGYVNFDVELIVSADEERACRVELQRWVAEEFARRKSSPSPGAGPEMSAAAPPTVILGDPTWCKGVAKLFAPQSTALVTGRVAEQPASLLAGNTAVFNMDLTSLGATFLVKTLIGDEGADAIDLTPIQVVYDLAFWGRMSQVGITIEASSKRVFTAVETLSEGPAACTAAELEDRRKQLSSESLVESGAVKVTLHNDDPTLPPEAVEALRKMAFEMFDTLLEQKFLTPAAKSADDPPDDEEEEPEERESPGEAPPPWSAMLYEHVDYGGRSQPIEGDVPDLGTVGMGDRVSSFKVRRGDRVTFYRDTMYRGEAVQYRTDTSAVGPHNDHFSSVRVMRSPRRRYRLKERRAIESMELKMSVAQAQVVEWRVAPQATLQTFFRGMTADQIRQHVRKIALGDPFFSTLALEVLVFADFVGEPIQRVDVEVEYGGEHRLFVFDGAGQRQSWDPAPSLKDGSREYRYRHRVVYKDGGGEAPFSAWMADSKNRLPLTVRDPGKIALEVVAGNIDWTLVRSVSIDVAYEDAAAGIERVARTLLLDAKNRVAAFTQHVFKQVTGPVSVQPTFFLEDGGQVKGEPAWATGQAIVHMPFKDFLDVSVVPSGDFSEVQQVVVSLRYDDGAGHTADRHFPITAADQLVRWMVALRDPEKRAFEYATLIVFKSAPPLRRDWQRVVGDQVIAVEIPPLPRLKVNVLANLVDFKATPVVKVDLSRPGGAPQSFSFSGAGALSAVWSVPLREGESREYSYRITYYPAAGEPVAKPLTAGAGTEIFIPAHRPKEVKGGVLEVRVMGNLLDFAATPLVQVDVRYRDEAAGIDRTEAAVLTKEAPVATLKLTQEDVNKRDLTYTVTFFKPAPEPPFVAPEQSTSVPTIIVRPQSP